MNRQFLRRIGFASWGEMSVGEELGPFYRLSQRILSTKNLPPGTWREAKIEKLLFDAWRYGVPNLNWLSRSTLLYQGSQ